MHLDSSITHRLEQRKMTETHASERRDFGFEFQIYFVTRVEKAEVDLGTLEHEPEKAIRVAAEPKQKHDALFGQSVDPNHPSERPHEEVRIEILVREVLARPSIAPYPERIDHRAKLAASYREAVFVPMAAIRRELLDDSAPLQRVEPLGQEVPGDPRDAAMDIGESPAAHHQLAQDERSPTLGEDLGTKRYGAELSVARHAPKVQVPSRSFKFNL
jgi:hypothetical protein